MKLGFFEVSRINDKKLCCFDLTDKHALTSSNMPVFSLFLDNLSLNYDNANVTTT